MDAQVTKEKVLMNLLKYDAWDAALTDPFYFPDILNPNGNKGEKWLSSKSFVLIDLKIQGLSESEIAKLLKIKISTLKQKLKKIKRLYRTGIITRVDDTVRKYKFYHEKHNSPKTKI